MSSSAALLSRYELCWTALGDANGANIARAAATATAAREAAARCDACVVGWRSLQAELAALPAVLSELSSGVTAACAQAEALEQRLREITVARIDQREARWRLLQLQEAERQRSEEATANAQREAAARRAAERERLAREARASELRVAAERERQSVFQEEYEAQRSEYLEARRQQTPAAVASAPAEEVALALGLSRARLEALATHRPAEAAYPTSIAEAAVPIVGDDDAALDAFYADDE